MITKFINGNIEMTEFDSFNIGEILECGQCFRFHMEEENKYLVVAHNKELVVKQLDDKVIFYNTTEEDFDKIWINYFDLSRDYLEIKKALIKDDDVMKNAIDFAQGIRILNQDKFECLISFIISQNNRIPMIKKVIANISEKFGNKINTHYSFPTIDQLKNATVEDFNQCKAGFRGKYIIDAIEKISSGELDIDKIDELSNEELQKELMRIKGVGPKVSDCVMLFSYARVDSFPIDVWVKRIMEFFYFDNEKTDKEIIQNLARENYGDYAGFAQQYLFHFARINQIGK